MIFIKKANYFFLVFFIFIFFNLFFIENTNSIIISSCNIWFNNLVPVIFPFYIITSLLINYGFLNLLKHLEKIIKFNSLKAFVLIFSMLTGCPSNAKYISELLKEDLISMEEANKIIVFSHFSNPLFIINTIGINILSNKFLGYSILISHFLSNFIISFLFKNKNEFKFKTPHPEKFSKLLSKSILDTFNSLLIILGNIICFRLLIEILNNYFKLSTYFDTFVSLILEITTGLFKLQNCSFSLEIKALIITGFLSFGGLSIHSQVYSILSETKIKYKNYLIGRIIQMFLSVLIFLVILFFHRI